MKRTATVTSSSSSALLDEITRLRDEVAKLWKQVMAANRLFIAKVEQDKADEALALKLRDPGFCPAEDDALCLRLDSVHREFVAAIEACMELKVPSLGTGDAAMRGKS